MTRHRCEQLGLLRWRGSTVLREDNSCRHLQSCTYWIWFIVQLSLSCILHVNSLAAYLMLLGFIQALLGEWNTAAEIAKVLLNASKYSVLDRISIQSSWDLGIMHLNCFFFVYFCSKLLSKYFFAEDKEWILRTTVLGSVGPKPPCACQSDCFSVWI